MKKILKQIFGSLYGAFLAKAYFKSFVLAQRNVHVINLHDIPPERRRKAGLFLNYCEHTFQVTSFEELLNRSWPKRGKPFLVLTFDDGFVSSCDLMNDHRNFPCMFFLVRDFLTPHASRLRDNLLRPVEENPELLVTQAELKLVLQKISATIGSHSSTHANLRKCDSISLREEIFASGDGISTMFNTKVSNFAFPFGRHEHINQEAMELIQQRYRHIFTNVRGVNTLKDLKEGRLVWRQNIDLNDNFSLMKFCILGGFDSMYRAERAALSAMASHKS